MSALYTPEMLALSTQLAAYPWSDRYALQAEARSKVCGSVITMGLDLEADGTVSAVGLKVSACAVGQSSAAIFARGVKGASPEDIADTLEALKRWLAKESDLPQLARPACHRGRA